MRKFILCIIATLICVFAYAQTDTTKTVELDAVSVVSFYRNTTKIGSLIEPEVLVEANYGQEPSHLFKKMPSIFSYSDNGTEFGYGYFRIRGLDQTRINVSIDGCPWNEAEDFGTYFANSPDLMSSMHSIKVERGTVSNYSGVAGSAGGINLESVDLKKDTLSYVNFGGGSFNTYKGNVVYNSGLTKHNWAVHVRATLSQTEGFRDYGFNNSQALTFKVGKYINSKHSIDFLSMTGQHKNGQGWIGNTEEELAVNPHANGNTKDEDDHWIMSMNRLQYRGWLTDNLLFTSSAYLQLQTGDYKMDLDNYMRRMADESWETTNILYDYGLKHYMAGGNIAVKYFFTNGNLVSGVNVFNYEREHFMADGGRNVSAEEYYDNVGKKFNLDAFVTASYSPVRNLNISANVQYRHADFNYRDKKDASVVFDSKALGTIWNFCNFGASVEYIYGDSKFYARYAQTHREPTRSDMFGGNEYFSGELATITPETANDVEVGVVFSTDKVVFNANGFYMWFKDELVLNGEYGPNGLPCHENVDNSYRGGIEVSLDWEIIKNLYMSDNFSLSENKMTSTVYGKRGHILSPSSTCDLDLRYDVDKNWKAGINWNYRSEVFVDMANEHSIPDAWTLNLYGSKYITDKIEIGAKLNNITNRVNYCTGSVGVNDKTLYFREAGFNFLINAKFIF